MSVSRASIAIPLSVALVSAVMGVFTVFYVGLVGTSPVRLAALPLVLVLLLVLVMDKQRLFMLIMLFRAACDPVFDAAKFNVGGANIGIGAALNALIIFIAMLFMMDRHSAKTDAGRLRIALWVPVVVLILLMVVARSPVKPEALRTFLVVMSYVAVFTIPFYMAKTGDGIAAGIRLVLLSSILPVLYAFVDIAMNHGQGGPDGFRLKSTFSHANIFAFYLLLVMSLLFYRLKVSTEELSSGKRWLLVAYLVVLIGLMMLTKTRSAWLGTFLLFGIYAARHERRLLIYLIVLPLLALLVPDVQQRVLDLGARSDFDQYAQLNSFDWRVQIWKEGIAWMKPMQLLIGYGLDGFQFYSPQFFSLAGGFHHGAHNVYVQWFFESGVLGMLCFIWVFYRLLKLMLRRASSDRIGTTIMVSLVAAYLLVCASDNMIDYLSFNWYFWFTCGVVCSAALAEAGSTRRTSTVSNAAKAQGAVRSFHSAPAAASTQHPLTPQQRRRSIQARSAAERLE